MANKRKSNAVVEKQGIKKKVVKSTVDVVIPTGSREVVKEKNSDWEIKDRTYILKGSKTPLSYVLKSSNIFYFDEEKGYERELRYTTNQKTVFVEDFKGDARLAHIIFEDGMLIVPKQKQTLQKLLSLYHPKKNQSYFEYNPVANAIDEVGKIELEIQALMAAQQMDIDMAEAVMRVELGSKVSKMSSKELKRDLLLFARNNPYLFLDLANDENVGLRNLAILATENNIITLSQDQRTFSWTSNGRKLMTVPFDENPYSAMAAFFKTDEGVEVFKSIEKKLK